MLLEVKREFGPTKWAANALLARVYLYTNQFAEAEKEASIILENEIQYGLEIPD